MEQTFEHSFQMLTIEGKNTKQKACLPSNNKLLVFQNGTVYITALMPFATQYGTQIGRYKTVDHYCSCKQALIQAILNTESTKKLCIIGTCTKISNDLPKNPHSFSATYIPGYLKDT